MKTVTDSSSLSGSWTVTVGRSQPENSIRSRWRCDSLTPASCLTYFNKFDPQLISWSFTVVNIMQESFGNQSRRKNRSEHFSNVNIYKQNGKSLPWCHHGNKTKMKLSLALTILTINAIDRGKSVQVKNRERMTISLENFDDLEMIPESVNHALINKKLEKFHDYVKKSNIVRHPWDKMFIKDSEYRKSEKSYRKQVEDAVRKMKGFNRRSGLHHRRIVSPPYVDKRQLSNVLEDGDDGDDDDDEDDGNLPPESNAKDLKKEYEKQIADDEEKQKAFRYSDKGKPEESINEAFQKIIDVKTPENCSNITGFGIQSVECLIKNYKSHEMTGKEAFVKFMKIFLIWIDLYVSIAIPLWCIKGWGCCCITWKYCRPRVLVKEVQRYVAENPPGVYVNEDGEEEHYAPTLREKELYDKINRKILNM